MSATYSYLYLISLCLEGRSHLVEAIIYLFDCSYFLVFLKLLILIGSYLSFYRKIGRCDGLLSIIFRLRFLILSRNCWILNVSFSQESLSLFKFLACQYSPHIF